MNTLKLTLVCLGTALALGGCSSAPDKNSSLTTNEEPAAPFLAEIPADTIYVFAGMEPVPGGLMLEKFAKWKPSIDRLISDFEASRKSNSDPDTEMAIALMKEMVALTSKEGLASAGMTPSPRHATYGIGVLPIMRFEIVDSAKFAAFVKRLELTAGFPPVMDTFEDVEFRRYTIDTEVTAMLRITGHEAIIGIVPQTAAALYIPHFTGRAKLTSSMATSKKLDELATRFSFKRFGVGFFDVVGLVSMILEPANDLNGQVAAALDIVESGNDPACIGEVKSIAARFPQVVAGYESFQSGEMIMRFGLLMGDQLGNQLMATKAPIPAFDSPYVKDAPLHFGLGLDLQKLSAMLQRQAVLIRDNPYACQSLTFFNNNAAQLAASIPLVPPILTQIRGATIAIQNIKLPKDQAYVPQSPDGSPEGAAPPQQPPIEAEGMVILSTQDPVSTLDTLKLSMPDLAAVTIAPNSQPEPLPDLEIFQGLRPIFAAMSKTMIAVAAGDASRERLNEVVTAQTMPTPMLSVRYDYGAILKMLEVDETYDEYDLIGLLTSLWNIDMVVDPTEDGLFATMTWRWTE